MKLLILCCLFTLGWCALRTERYRGHKVFGVTPETKVQLSHLKALQKNWKLRFLSEPLKTSVEVEIVAPPAFQDYLRDILADYGFKYEVKIEDFEHFMQEYWEEIVSIKAATKVFDINNWNTYEDIMSQLDVWVASCPSEITCETYVAGKSYEDRELKVLKISSGPGKQAIWMDSLIHAREWLAGTTVLKIMDRMTQNYNSDPVVKRLIDSYDWYFLPVMNPDGYAFTWSTEGDRLWRKSRNDNMDEVFGCLGTDLNRNYEYFWNTGGSGDLFCADDYRGSVAASEPETKVVQAEARKLVESAGGALAWITVHTAAEMVLIPYGFVQNDVCVRPEDHDELQRVADAMCVAITETTNEYQWECGNGCELLYDTSGTTMDFTKSIGIKYSYTPELRGPFFDPPQGSIEPGYQEFWNGVVAMVDSIENPPK